MNVKTVPIFRVRVVPTSSFKLLKIQAPNPPSVKLQSLRLLVSALNQRSQPGVILNVIPVGIRVFAGNLVASGFL